MIILGITGPIGHGKTTFSNALAEMEPKLCHLESSMLVSEVANAMHAALQTPPDPKDVSSINAWLQSLPDIVFDVLQARCAFEHIKLDENVIKDHPGDYQKLILHIENLQRDPSLGKSEITQENKNNFRPFLQWLGGYLVQKVGPGVWYNEMVRRVEAARLSGCELCIVGGVRYPMDATILRSKGAKIVKIYRPGHLQSDMLEPTERERDDIHPDSTIMSNGGLDDLRLCAEDFLKDLHSDNLQKLYYTKRS